MYFVGLNWLLVDILLEVIKIVNELSFVTTLIFCANCLLQRWSTLRCASFHQLLFFREQRMFCFDKIIFKMADVAS